MIFDAFYFMPFHVLIRDNETRTDPTKKPEKVNTSLLTPINSSETKGDVSLDLLIDSEQEPHQKKSDKKPKGTIAPDDNKNKVNSYSNSTTSTTTTATTASLGNVMPNTQLSVVNNNEIGHTLLLDSTEINTLTLKLSNQSVGNDNSMQLNKALTQKKKGDCTNAISIFTVLAEKEDLNAAIANYQLGKIFQQGLGVAPNEESAAEYYTKAIKILNSLAEGNDKKAGQANYILGKMWQHGLGVAQNEKTAKQYYKKAQKKYFAKASTVLGEIFKKEKDFKKAKDNYQRAIFQSPGKGSARACFQLANLYEEGLGTKINRDKAIENYKLAIEKGNHEAYIDLGNLYWDEGNYEQAFECYQQVEGEAAAQSCLELGDIYGAATGINDDFDYAERCYHEAEKKGSPHACIKLGDLCCVTKKLDQAFEHYKRARGELAAKSFDYLGHLFCESSDFEKATKCYQIAAEHGYADAWIHLGDLFKNQGKYEEAFYFYQKAEGKNAARSCHELGQLHRLNGEKGYAEAIKCFEVAVKKGLTEALIDLGLIFRLKKEYQQAEHYFQLAGQEDLADVCLHLGDLYVEQGKLKLAFESYEKGSGQNAAQATRKLGHIFSSQLNMDMTVKCYELAEQQGSIEASYDLGCLYLNQKNYQTAASYFEKIKKIHGSAVNNLGKLYLDGLLGNKPDYALALICFQDAVNLGYAKANTNIGYMYYKALGVLKDTQVAMSYFMKGQKADSPSACFYLGEIFQIGIDVKQDFAKAVYWYQTSIILKNPAHESIKKTIDEIKVKNTHLSNVEYERIFNTNYPLAEQENADAQYWLGVMYMRKGEFYVKQSDTTAEHYLTSAWENGHSKAAYKLGISFETRSNLLTQSNQKAVEWYSRACDSSDSKSAFKAAEKLVVLGAGKVDLAKALKVFKTAAKNGNNLANKHLGDMYYCGLGTESNMENALFYYRKYLKDDKATLVISQTSFVKKQGLGNQQIIVHDRNRQASEQELLFESLFPLAEEGNQNAQLQLGLMYLDGYFGMQSLPNADKYFELACQNNLEHTEMVAAAYRDRDNHKQANYWQQRQVLETNKHSSNDL
jgi:TPR repeat protein